MCQFQRLFFLIFVISIRPTKTNTKHAFFLSFSVLFHSTACIHRMMAFFWQLISVFLDHTISKDRKQPSFRPAKLVQQTAFAQ